MLRWQWSNEGDDSVNGGGNGDVDETSCDRNICDSRRGKLVVVGQGTIDIVCS